MKKQKINTAPLWRFLFLVYCAAMLWLLFGRSNGWTEGLPYQTQLQQNTNLIPFYTIRNYLYVLQHTGNQKLFIHSFINLGGNVLLFIPAGWLLPKLWPRQRNFLRFFATCFGAIFLVEILQLFSLLGRFDVDDLILNLLGMVLGFLFQRIFAKR